jgi:hypothetical protein
MVNNKKLTNYELFVERFNSNWINNTNNKPDNFKNYFSTLGITSAKEKEKTVNYIYNRLSNHIKNKNDVFRSIKLIGILYSHLNVEQQIESVIYNLQFNFNKIPINLPEGFIKKTNYVDGHVESPNEIKIIYVENNNKQDVATFNIYLIKKGESVELRINNIQGAVRSSHFLHKNVNYRRFFGKLNNYYKDDWRVGIVKQVNEFGKANRLKLKLELPKIYSAKSTGNQYLLSILDYLETGLKAGISLENISVFNVHKYVPNKSETKSLLDYKTGLINLMARIKNKPKEEQIRIVELLRLKHSNYTKKSFVENTKIMDQLFAKYKSISSENPESMAAIQSLVSKEARWLNVRAKKILPKKKLM